MKIDTASLKPKFTHDCNNGVYLGHHVQDGRTYELYVCTCQGGTLIARSGSDGPEYMSQTVAVFERNFDVYDNDEVTRHMLPLRTAYFRASACGFLVR